MGRVGCEDQDRCGRTEADKRSATRRLIPSSAGQIGAASAELVAGAMRAVSGEPAARLSSRPASSGSSEVSGIALRHCQQCPPRLQAAATSERGRALGKNRCGVGGPGLPTTAASPGSDEGDTSRRR